MDIGISDYIKTHEAINDSVVAGLSAQIQNVAAGWSNDKAVALANLLSQVPEGSIGNRNNQKAAVLDLLSLFALSRQASGSRDDVKAYIVNGSSAAQQETIVKAMFGVGDVGLGLAGSLLVGATGMNTYPYMIEALRKLGISATNSGGHENHFHLYLRPP